MIAYFGRPGRLFGPLLVPAPPLPSFFFVFFVVRAPKVAYARRLVCAGHARREGRLKRKGGEDREFAPLPPPTSRSPPAPPAPAPPTSPTATHDVPLQKNSPPKMPRRPPTLRASAPPLYTPPLFLPSLRPRLSRRLWPIGGASICGGKLAWMGRRDLSSPFVTPENRRLAHGGNVRRRSKQTPLAPSPRTEGAAGTRTPLRPGDKDLQEKRGIGGNPFGAGNDFSTRLHRQRGPSPRYRRLVDRCRSPQVFFPSRPRSEIAAIGLFCPGGRSFSGSPGADPPLPPPPSF